MASEINSAGMAIDIRAMPNPVVFPRAAKDLLDVDSSLSFRTALVLSSSVPRGKERIVRWMQRILFFGVPRRLCTHHNTWLVTDPTNLEVYVRLARVRNWDDHVMTCCIDLLREGDSFFDVGSNAGYISIQVAAALNGRLDISAFEPQPTLAEAAAGSADLNGFDRMKVYRIMVGRPAAAERVYVTGSSLHTSRIPRGRPKQTIEASVYSMQELVASGTCRSPDVIKVDVEGGEMEVITSSRELLRSVQPAIALESDANTARFGYGRQELVQALRECGYTNFFHVLEDGRYVPLSAKGIVSRDIVAVPPLRMTDRFRAKIAG